MKSKLKLVVAIILTLAITLTATACGADAKLPTQPTSSPDVTATPEVEEIDDTSIDSTVNPFDFELIGVDGTYATEPIQGSEVPHFVVLKWNKEKMKNHEFNNINNFINVSVKYEGDGNSSVIDKKYQASSKQEGEITFIPIYENENGTFSADFSDGEMYLGLPLYTSGKYTINLDIDVIDKGFDYANADSEPKEYETISLSTTGFVEKSVVQLFTFNKVHKQDVALGGVDALEFAENVELEANEFFAMSGINLSDEVVANILNPVGYKKDEIYLSYSYDLPLQLNEIGQSVMNVSFREKNATAVAKPDDEIISTNDLVWVNYEYHLMPSKAYVISPYDYQEIFDVATSIAEIPYTDPDSAPGTQDAEELARLVNDELVRIFIQEGMAPNEAETLALLLSDMVKDLIKGDGKLDSTQKANLIKVLDSLGVSEDRHDEIIAQIESIVPMIKKLPTGSYDEGFETQATLAFMRYSQLTAGQQAWFVSGTPATLAVGDLYNVGTVQFPSKATVSDFGEKSIDMKSNVAEWAIDYSELSSQIKPENASSLLAFMLLAYSEITAEQQVAKHDIAFKNLGLPSADKFDVTNESHLELAKNAVEYVESLNAIDQASAILSSYYNDYTNAKTQLINIETQRVMAEISALDYMYRTIAPKFITFGTSIVPNNTGINTTKLYFYDMNTTYGGVKFYIDNEALFNQAQMVLESFNALEVESQNQLKNSITGQLVAADEIESSPYHPTTVKDGGNGSNVTYFGALIAIYNMETVVDNMKKVTDHVNISSYYNKEMSEAQAYSHESSLIFDNLNLLVYGYQPFTKIPLNIMHSSKPSVDFFGRNNTAEGVTQHFATSDIAYATIHAPNYVETVVAEYIAWIDVIIALEEYKNDQIELLDQMIKAEFSSDSYTNSDYSIATHEDNGAYKVLVASIMNEVKMGTEAYSSYTNYIGKIYNAPHDLTEIGLDTFIETTFLEILDYENHITPSEAAAEFDTMYDIDEALEWFIVAYKSTDIVWGTETSPITPN